ncbi:C1 family peptidase [Haloarcula marina]|uniref:C1 family peptidase n=1 Tax=Haloarcula marina TaxID=2961574 RepID=UPI0020B8C559|nr:C1 family peptidase [Halomicroarcula marina]
MLEAKVDRRTDFHEVQDQGPFKTCLSYATSAVHRINKNIEYSLSAEALHYTASEGGFRTGCNMMEIQEALFETGQPERHHCEEITMQNHLQWSPPSGVEYYQSDSSFENASIEVVQRLIQEGRYPILGIAITDKFRDPEPPWVLYPGEIVGRHAVVGVGLGEFNGNPVILVRNSWGSEWADSGYAWLDRSFLEDHLEGLLLVNRGED